jgi:FixJ family two-component response regulator
MSLTFDAGRWVAIVDDDESIRRALGRLLRAHGIEARAFASARDYLSRAQGLPPVSAWICSFATR